jgi:ABC-type multidrug transport system fused ATPase/permease subunit
VLTVSGAVSCIVQLVLVALGSGYMAATFPLLIPVLYFVQKFYLRTSRQLRFLDLEAKSPLYQQFTETLEGVATIRAMGSQEWFEQDFLSRLDESQKPYYFLLCIQRWLMLVLDMVVGATAVVLVALACATRSSSAGSLGVALTTILAMNSQLQNLISAWTQAETSLGSVARTKEYEAKTPNENLPMAQHPEAGDESWPMGTIKISSLTIKYREGDDEYLALQDVSIVVEAGKKLGICGRTGR